MNEGNTRWTGPLLLALGLGAAAGIYFYRNRYSFSGKVAVITGGSRGLGLLLARELADEGARLALLARKEEELRRAEAELRARGAEVFSMACDVSKQVQVNDALAHVHEQFGAIDVLINNAGIIQVGPIENMTVSDFAAAMAIHFYGPLYASLAAIPHLRRAGGGRIVNIASIGGKIAVPHMAPYTASKFALVGLSDAFRAELRKDNILVTTVCPCPIRTGSLPNAQFKGNYRKEYAWFAISDSLPLLSMNAERAARKIIAACRRGSARLLLGVQTKAAVLLNEFFPGATARLFALANDLLPTPGPASDAETHSGFESAWAHSWLTRLNYYAALKNNERPPVA